jgi:hypothetical protein
VNPSAIWCIVGTFSDGLGAKQIGMDGEWRSHDLEGVYSPSQRQDLHAFLLDNYFLLTRDEENGKHVVVSRVG